MFSVEHILLHFCMVFNDVTVQILKERQGSKLQLSAFSFRIARRVFTNLHCHFCFTYTLKMEATLFPKHRCPATMLQCPIFQKVLIQFFTAVKTSCHKRTRTDGQSAYCSLLPRA